MSFFTYYGKLKNDLLVVVLPSGTVQPLDSVYVYSCQKLESFAAQTVVTSSSGDRFSFHDNDSSYEVESLDGYKQLVMTVKSSNNAKVELTRVYAESQDGRYHSNYPRIWTGPLNFHEWAKNQPFIIVAPKGVGNGKPVVSIWQWTVDAKGTPKTLSYGAFIQSSNKVDNFSFKQNEYYNLVCQVESTTGGLNIDISSSTNPSVAQQLILAAKIEPGDRHKLSPPRPVQQEMKLKCSAPLPEASLDRITKPLPFPSDLIGALTYSAAYVDHAGHLAKYAVKQYDKLDAAYHKIEQRLDEKAEQITDLETKNKGLATQVEDLKKRNTGLEGENHHLREQLRAALEKAAADQKKANETIKDLEQQLVGARNEISTLWRYIREDSIEDAKRAAETKRHDKADHKIIESLRKDIACLEQKIRDLECTVEDKKREIRILTDAKRDVEQQLKAAKDLIAKLRGLLAAERIENQTLKANLKSEEKKVADLEKVVRDLTDDLEFKTKKVKDLEENVDRVTKELSKEVERHGETTKERNALRAQMEKEDEDDKEAERQEAERKAQREKRAADRAKALKGADVTVTEITPPPSAVVAA